MNVLGIDTSCYTTSVAAAGEEGVICSHRKLLPVQAGARGLRQSEAVFAHIKQLPDLYDAAMQSLAGRPVDGVCVSAAPRDGESSYMPVFQAGLAFARVAAASLTPLRTQPGTITFPSSSCPWMKISFSRAMTSCFFLDMARRSTSLPP